MSTMIRKEIPQTHWCPDPNRPGWAVIRPTPCPTCVFIDPVTKYGTAPK